MHDKNVIKLTEQEAVLLEQAASMLEGLEHDERNRGNCSTAEGAGCSAHAVRRLASALLAHEREIGQCLHQIAEPAHPTACTVEEVRAFEAASAKAVPDVRAEFEAWVTTVDDHPLTRLGDGYNWHSIQAKWELWKSACAALAAAPAAPAPVVLPSGWVPCIVTYEGQHPEEVAYGPQVMMDRLKKWLERYFELKAAAPVVLPEPRWHDPKPCDAAHFPYYTPEDVRALLAGVSAHAIRVMPTEHDAVISEVMNLVNEVQKNRVCAEMSPSNKDHFNDRATEASKAIESKLRALLATAPAAPAVEQLTSELEDRLKYSHARLGHTERFIELKASVAEAIISTLKSATAADALDATRADAQEAAITWPKARDVGRIGDMSAAAHIRVGLDSDNDVYVSVWDENGGGSIEFCNPGGGGGGQSSRTRVALIALMAAMEADNAEKPSRDWWAQRAGQAAQGGKK